MTAAGPQAALTAGLPRHLREPRHVRDRADRDAPLPPLQAVPLRVKAVETVLVPL